MGILWAVIVLAILGVIFGILLPIFSVVFKVKEDPRIEEVTKMLPGYNCGSCGFAGCQQMAEALVKGEEKTVAKCRPSKAEVKEAIMKYLKEHPNEE